MRRARSAIAPTLIAFVAVVLPVTSALAQTPVFRAGAAKVDIAPRQFPVVVSGMFLGRQGVESHGDLFSRALVLDDGEIRIAIVIVDSLMIRRELLDEAKAAASKATGIPAERMLISATHTHSAPSVMGALGTGIDERYRKFLPGKIVESIVQANSNLQPAKIGWAVAKDYAHNHCRRWVFRPDRIGKDPFGQTNVRAMMHPGYQSGNHIGPAGPADPDLSLLAVRTTDGKPLAVLANYAMHYKGSPMVSGDVCGRFGPAFAKLIDADDSFVGALSQGTSGDSMWMNYAAPKNDPGLDAYTESLARSALEAWNTVEFRDHASLAMAEAKLKLRRRVPAEKRLEWARGVVAGLPGGVPRDRPQVYAREAIYLHEKPEVELKLQALRIGELGIATLPNEVYGITGLKLKARSPLKPTFNIELANGAQGYIPPPEQHHLGGYTTWPARTAGLEVGAEPRIVETLLGLLEEVSGRERVESPIPEDDYLAAVRASKPVALWRFDEMDGSRAGNAIEDKWHGKLEPGIAFHLPGRSPAGLEFAEQTPNRALHFAGGRMIVDVPGGNPCTIEFWFWNGMPAESREVTGVLFEMESENGRERLAIDRGGELAYSSRGTAASLKGKTKIESRSWNHVAVVRAASQLSVYLNGKKAPEIRDDARAGLLPEGIRLWFGGGADSPFNLEGKLDDVSFYQRALTAEEIARHFAAAKLGAE